MTKDRKSAYRDYLLRSVQEWIADGTRIAIFGTGEHTNYLFRCVPELDRAHITGYLDSDEGRQGNRYRGSAIHPIEWAKENADVILCSSFVNERAMAEVADGLGCKVVLSHLSQDSGFESDTRRSRNWIASKLSFGANTISDASSLQGLPGNYDILIFPVIDWNYRFQRPQQLAKRLAAAGNRVFYLRNRLSGSRRMLVRSMLPNLWTVELPGPDDFNLYRDPIKPLLAESIVENISLLQSRLNIKEAFCLVQFPAWTRPAFELKKRFGWKLVYDCMDYHAGFSNVVRACIKDEPELIRRSDLIFASSHVLQKQILPLNKRCILLPNAGEFDHFSRRAGKAHKSVELLPRPVLGYYGAISQWFDARLVAGIARRRRDWSFVLIGNTHGAFLGRLKEQENVRFLPEQDYAKLPELLNAFDVCIIPFKKCKLTDATNPVKIYEYCASGKPIVASNLEELRWYKKHVRLATTVQGWIDAIEKALLRRNSASVRSRRLFAKLNNWDERARVLIREIQKIRDRRSASTVDCRQRNRKLRMT